MGYDGEPNEAGVAGCGTAVDGVVVVAWMCVHVVSGTGMGFVSIWLEHQ